MQTKEQQAAYYKAWYANPENAKRHRDRAKAINKQNRANVRALILEAKSVPCMDCGQQFPFPAMDFDHVRGEKKFNLGASTWKSKSLKAVREEIAKCDVVCSNCHRIRTYTRKYGDIV